MSISAICKSFFSGSSRSRISISLGKCPSPTKRDAARYLLRGLVACVLSICGTGINGALAQTTTPSRPSSCIWFSDAKAIHQVTGDTNQVVQAVALQNTSALAMNSKECGVWAVAEKQLYQLDSRTAQKQQIALQALNDRLNLVSLLLVDGFDSSLWLSDGKTILHLASTGQLSASITALGNIDSFALALDQSLWVLGSKQLWQYNGQGTLLTSIDLHSVFTSEPKFLVVDSLNGFLWLAGEKQLTRFNLSHLDQAPLTVTLPDVVNSLALNPSTGEVWSACNNTLLSYGLDGMVGHVIDLKAATLENPNLLAFDPTTQTLWLTAGKALARFSAQGALVANLANTTNENALAAPAFAIVPSIALVRPPADGLTNNPTPPISYRYGASCNGQPCTIAPSYPASYSLTATLNQSTIGQFVFDPLSGQATYIPASRLPEGQNTLVAQARDAFGHLSNITNDKFTIDTIPPKFLTLSPVDGTLTNKPAALIQGTVDDVTASVVLSGVGAGTNTAIVNGTLQFGFPVALKDGFNTFNLSAWDLANNSGTATLHLTLDTIPPKFLNVTPANGTTVLSPQVTITGSVDDPTAAVTLANYSQWNATGANPADQNFSWTVTLKPGSNTFNLSAADKANNMATYSMTLTFTPPPPSAPDATKVSLGTLSNGTVTLTGIAGAVGSGLQVSITNGRTQQTVTVNADDTGAFSASVDAQGGDTLTVKAVDQWGGASPSDSFTVANVGPAVPPDPATIAPPIDLTVPTQIATSTAFLYSGPNPIQTGVEPGTIDPKRVAVLRGKIMTRDNQSLPGVTITVLGHPEFGQTGSRLDGMFDMAANGGGYLTVNYAKAGYLPIQRTLNTPWNDFVIAPDVVMIPLDAQATTINLSAATPIQVARGSVVNDQDGTRQATLLVRQGTTATMVLADGSTQNLTSITVRATEYTVGPNGPKAMPGPLPASSGYTYAVEYSIDEAITAGATRVWFNQPVYQYVENFLNFPVGGIVPVGYYDRQKATWIPSNNGVIVKILSIANGLAVLDTTGSGTPDSGTRLTMLNVSDDERRQLASLYPIGSSFWRVPIMHFTPWDSNWPSGPPDDAKPPTVRDPKKSEDEDKPDCKAGSIIECQNQSLGETVPIVGTPFSLNYKSSRQSGEGMSTLSIPLSDASLPASVKRIELEVSIAGQHFTQSFSAVPNQSYTFTWDGRDAYGREVQGRQTAWIRLGYVYGLRYLTPDAITPSFGNFGTTPISGLRTLGDLTLWKEAKAILGHWAASGVGLGAWTISVQHAYDPGGQVVFYGDGRTRTAQSMNGVIDTVAGNGAEGFSGDGGLATEATFYIATRTAVDSRGNLYISDANNNRIRKVTPERIISTVAGMSSVQGYSGDGGPATSAALANPRGVTVDAQGNLYIADSLNHRIRKVSPAGIITTVAGNGSRGFYGDGGQARYAALYQPGDVAIDAQGNLYIADSANKRIRKVTPDGIIRTVAGIGSYGLSGDGIPAKYMVLNGPSSVALDAQGNIYTADSVDHVVRKITPDGIVYTVAGTGLSGFSGDGGPAKEAMLNSPTQVTLDAQGNLYIADMFNFRIRKVTQDGMITTVAGGDIDGFAGDKGYATAAKLSYPTGITIDPTGKLYIADTMNFRVRAVSSNLPYVTGLDFIVASEDGSEIYHFGPDARHLRTLDAFTGAIIFRFNYDSNGLLSQIVDGDNNVTSIERDSAGNPGAIVAPNGNRTALALDPNGYLSAIVNPANEVTRMTYASNGLLATFTNPRQQTSTMTYDTISGRLIKDQNAAGGYSNLTRNELGDGIYRVDLTSAEGRTKSYMVEKLSTGGTRLTNVQADGSVSIVLQNTDGSKQTTAADGTFTTAIDGPDPRFGMQAPITLSAMVKTPSGLTGIATINRQATLSNPADLLSLVTQTDTVTVNGKTASTVFNAALRQWTSTSPLGRKSIVTTDVQGRPLSMQVPGLEPVNFYYDPRGRLSSITQGTGANLRTTEVVYNSQGFVDSVTDPLRQKTSFQQDMVGRITQATLPDTSVINLHYDPNGNVDSVTPPGRPSHAFSYTTVDLVESYVPPVLGARTPTTKYDYNLDKQLTQITLPDGQIIVPAYAAVSGRLTGLTTPDGTTFFTYKPVSGQIDTLTTPDGATLSFSYDGMLPLSETWTGTVTGTVSRTYNNNFRVSGLTVKGQSISYGYDDDLLLTQAGNLAISRDPNNGLVTGTSLGSVATASTYNGFGELAMTNAVLQGGSTMFSTSYVRDNLGRITDKRETTGGMSDTFGYTYDPAGRLTDVVKNGVNVAHYTYGANGNRASLGSISAVYDDEDRLIQYGAATYGYTANGELQSKTVGAQVTGYAYDVMGNLRKVTQPDGSVIDYVIDGRNRRVGKKVNGILVQGFLYQGQLRPAAELNAAGNIVSRFVYGIGVNVPDYMVKGGVNYRLIKDHLGSPRLVINTATGDIVQRMDYDEFGNVMQDTNPGFQPFGFAGGLYDRDTGLTRFGVRDYDPQTGRWTAKDPIRFNGGDASLYNYVGNDPVNGIDPSGLVLAACYPSEAIRSPDEPPRPQNDFEQKVAQGVVDGTPLIVGGAGAVSTATAIANSGKTGANIISLLLQLLGGVERNVAPELAVQGGLSGAAPTSAGANLAREIAAARAAQQAARNFPTADIRLPSAIGVGVASEAGNCNSCNK